jgi:type IV pilus assembly protein PilB
MSGPTSQPPAIIGVPARQVSSLGLELVRSGVITNDELDAARAEQVQRGWELERVLLELGFISEDELVPFTSRLLGVASLRLREGHVDPQVVQLLPRIPARRMKAIALFRVRDELTVAMAEPQCLDHTDEIERITGLEVRPVYALASTIDQMLERAYDNGFGDHAITADFDQNDIQVDNELVSIELESGGLSDEASPVINLVNYVIVHAVRQGASDAHIEPGLNHSIVRFRIDGQLREVLRPRREFHPAIVSRLKVMAKLDIAEHRTPQDGRIQVSVEGAGIDLRVSTLPTVRGEKVVLRVLDRRNITFNLNDLGIPTHLLERMEKMLTRPHGLMLVTGPTGSGKTTTLYSALELVKSVEKNIVTVEDPVEYQLELINQIQAGSRQLNFSTALRSILRQDPDIIMVGEIRDRETAEIAIQAALTGHLVLSTLHTNDSPSVVTRLLDMGVESFKISAALVGAIAQRLVRTICPSCRTTYYPAEDLLESIEYTGDRRRQFVRGEGCHECFDTGFRGRIGIYEVMLATRRVRELIAKSPDIDQLRRCHLDEGGTTLMQAGIRMAEEGRTSLEEVVRAAMAD